MVPFSNGKSSIVAERLYSFFFALFKKNEASFFFVFPSTQLLTKMFVLLRSCKILKEFTSFCYVLRIFGIHLFVLPSFFESIGPIPWSFSLRPWQGEDNISFCFVLATLRTKPTCFRFDLKKFGDKKFVSFSILLDFSQNSFSLRSWLVVG